MEKEQRLEMIKRKMSAWDNLRFGKGLVEECLKKALNMEEEQEASGATNTASQEPVKGCEVCREEPKCGKAKLKEGVCVNLEGSLFATKPSTAHLLTIVCKLQSTARNISHISCGTCLS